MLRELRGKALITVFLHSRLRVRIDIAICANTVVKYNFNYFLMEEVGPLSVIQGCPKS